MFLNRSPKSWSDLTFQRGNLFLDPKGLSQPQNFLNIWSKTYTSNIDYLEKLVWELIR